MDANLVEIDKWEENTFLQILSRNFIQGTIYFCRVKTFVLKPFIKNMGVGLNKSIILTWKKTLSAWYSKYSLLTMFITSRMPFFLWISETSWIGATDSRLEETWQWTDSNDTFSFTAWGEKQPNNYHNQDCLTLFDEFDYLWADEHCTNNLYKYTCEKLIWYCIRNDISTIIYYNFNLFFLIREKLSPCWCI